MQKAEARSGGATQDIIVYFVDDDRGMVTATSQWLSLSGFTVRAFADPAALIKGLKPSVPCVVVSDIRMPGIDGLELMKLIHSRESRIPVILITGHGDIPLAVEAMKQGAFEFLPKPFSPEKLLETVSSAQECWKKDCAASVANPSGEIAKAGNINTDRQSGDSAKEGNLSVQLDAYEKELIESAFLRHNGTIAKVMEELNIPRRTLNAKMKKYGIVRSSYRSI